jgi:hydroxyacylglutathione hydrolase
MKGENPKIYETKLNERILVVLIPALTDNYIFLIVDQRSASAIVVDPATAHDVQRTLESLSLRLVAVLNTHHHWDHVGGNKALKEHWPELKIYGAAHDASRIPGITHPVHDADCIKELDIDLTVMDVRGHTNGHIAFWIEETQDLFAGDTLFGCGSGKLFEGTPQQMMGSLARLRALPDDTRVWCAHEYTEKNARIALDLGEPGQTDLSAYYARVQAKRARNDPTVPLRLGDEKKANPFLRWDSHGLKETLSAASDLDTFTAVRTFRDRF